MTHFLGSILVLLLMAAIALVVAILAVAGFIGIGALFARYTELTLFQATLIAVPVGIAALYFFDRIMNIPVSTNGDDWDELEDWDEDLDFEDLPPWARRRILQQLVESLGEIDDQDVVIEPRARRKRRRR